MIAVGVHTSLNLLWSRVRTGYTVGVLVRRLERRVGFAH